MADDRCSAAAMASCNGNRQPTTTTTAATTTDVLAGRRRVDAGQRLVARVGELSEVRITLTARTTWIGGGVARNSVRVAEAPRRAREKQRARDVEVFAHERWLDDRTADVYAALDARVYRGQGG